MASYTTDENVLSEPFTLLAVLAFLWRNNVERVFCSCCTIGKRYLPACYNSQNKQEVCLINVWWDVDVGKLFLQQAEAITRKVRERACNVYSTSDCDMNQNCTKNLSWPLVASVQYAAGSVTVGRWNNGNSRFCEGVPSSTEGHFVCLGGHVVLRRSKLPLGWLH
jgi:hypothetical protein